MDGAIATDRPATAPRRAGETWIFDLDNTLYHPGSGVLERINARMTGFIARECGLDRARAEDLRARYWRRYGITLAGLVRHHGVDPGRFLAEVHDVALDGVAAEPGLDAALARLAARPGARLVVHTNAGRAHAARVLDRLGLADAFDAVYAIEDKALAPKPRPTAYAAVAAAERLDPTRATMVEDTAENLREPRRLGMATVWLTEGAGPAPAHVDRRIAALVPWLDAL